MSSFVTEHFVKQYTGNVFHLSQQQGSKLRDKVRTESQKGKEAFYDRIGAVDAVKKTVRHGDTPQLNTPHSRRKVTMSDYEWADLIDDVDKIRMLNDPTSDYAKAAAWAMGRSMDDEIILAASGLAYSGEEGTTSVALPNTRKITAVSGGAFSNMNVATLRLAKKKFDDEDVDEAIPRYMAITSSELQSLLAKTEITSSDYNTVKALVNGEINTFMGFSFVRTQRLALEGAAPTFSLTTGEYDAGGTAPTGPAVRRCIAWARDGLLLSVGQNPKGKISERDDKSYATQVYMSMSCGATRMEEAKVVQVLVKED